MKANQPSGFLLSEGISLVSMRKNVTKNVKYAAKLIAIIVNQGTAF